MDLYSVKSKSIPQKLVIILLEILLLIISYWILFLGGGEVAFEKIGIASLIGNQESRIITFSFSVIVFLRMTFMMIYLLKRKIPSVIVFLRMTFMMIYLLKRKIPWEESFSIPMAFALYFIGFPFLVYNREIPIDWIDYLAIAIFILGSGLNTISEVQRHFWKKRIENKGKLYIIGLFKYSMHINFFGDILWVSAYAMITRSYYSIAIPILLFCLFTFWNIPALDKYLAGKYKDEFDTYKKTTKKLIPFIY